MEHRPLRVVLVSFGTRGDVLPFCHLGRLLQERGHAVRFVTTQDYHDTIGRFGIEVAQTGQGFGELLKDAEFESLFRDFFATRLSMFRHLRGAMRKLEDRAVDLLNVTLDEVARADVVVFNPLAYFVGAFARQHGIPAVRVMCQPLMPSRRTSLSLFGGRSFGSIGNRLSYETLRVASPMLRRTFARIRRDRGPGATPGAFANPLTHAMREIHHIAAFSPNLSPDPGDWPVPVLASGAWQAPPPREALAEHIEAFLQAGEPPIYIGFGSVLWGTARNTEVVLKALALWGGRAIVNEGYGALRLPPWGELPKTIQATTHVAHAHVFPRVRAVVHHGGAGTTAAALRAGRPSVVLPLHSEELYWGRRVAAVGAGEAPIPLSRITPEELAARIERACTDPAMAAAAADVARRMAGEPGVAAAADFIEALPVREREAA